MAGNFEKLVKSQDIFISTQQSGTTGASATQEFNSFKVCFNQHPLQCSANQFIRLSVTQFWSYRNWYYVNDTNNKIIIGDNDGGGTPVFVGDLNFASQDFENIFDIASAFGTALASKLTALASSHAGFPAGTWTFTSATDNTTTPTATGGTGTRRMEIKLSFSTALGDFQNLVLQCPQYYDSITTASATTISDNFNDSYALLGGKRISDSTDKTSQSFDLFFDTGANTLSIVGYYPMQRTTTPYLYLRCSHNGFNLETQNLENYQVTQDEHIINSTIIAKMPVNDNSVMFQYDALSPYFVDIESRFVSELDFRITDGHGRPVPVISDDADTDGNLFTNMTIKANTYEVPPSPFELQTTPPPAPLFDKDPYNITYLSQQRPNPFARNV